MKILLDILRDLVYYGLEKYGKYYSKYRGFVYDREDPEGYGRLMVSVPEVFGDMVLKKWAWPASNYSGNGYGFQVIPKRNDMVWVEFEKGNPKKPIWSYGYFGKGEKPDNLKDPNNYWFKTPNGAMIEFDNTNGIIKITNHNGKTIEFKESTLDLLDGSFGGLAIVSDLVAEYNDIQNDINDLKSTLSSWTPVANDGGAALKAALASYYASTLTLTQEADIENTKVNHGE